MRHDKLIAALFGAFIAYRYGPWLGVAFWPSVEPSQAKLYGSGVVFLVGWLAGYFAITHSEPEKLFSVVFAVIVTYWYAVPVGYQFFGMHDHVGAAIYGSCIFFPAALVGFLGWIITYRIWGASAGRAARRGLDRQTEFHL